jgi:hypothetical protein
MLLSFRQDGLVPSVELLVLAKHIDDEPSHYGPCIFIQHMDAEVH